MSRDPSIDSFEVLVFEVGGRRYGLDSSQVIEIVRAASVEALPKALVTVDGLLNVRGEVAPVFDLRSRFGLAPRPPEHTDHYIIARAGERMVVVRADRTIALMRLAPDEVRAAQDVLPGAEYISEVVTLPEGLLLIYDLASFLSSTESAIVADALHEVQADVLHEAQANLGEDDAKERQV